MHLSDEQLYRVLQTTTSDEQVTEREALLAHLQVCDKCNERFENLKAFRARLTVAETKNIPNFDFTAVKQAASLNTLTTEAKTSHNANQKVTTLQINTKTKRIVIFALAASLLIWMVYPSFVQDNTLDQEAQLAQLILDNKNLQQTLSQTQRVSETIGAIALSNDAKLNEIDTLIQQSYIRDHGIEHKISLWQQRKTLLLESLNKQQNGQATKLFAI